MTVKVFPQSGTATASGSGGTTNAMTKFNASGELADSALVETSSTLLTVPDDYQIGRDSTHRIKWDDTNNILLMAAASFNVIQVSGVGNLHQSTGAHQFTNGGTVTFELKAGGVFITEMAAAAADQAGKGQFWVRDDTPNVPMFTNDAGTDYTIDITAA